MDVLNREILNDLSQKSGQYLLSLFMPTHRVGREMQQDPIRFKNLLSSAEQRLEERGLRILAAPERWPGLIHLSRFHGVLPPAT